MYDNKCDEHNELEILWATLRVGGKTLDRAMDQRISEVTVLVCRSEDVWGPTGGAGGGDQDSLDVSAASTTRRREDELIIRGQGVTNTASKSDSQTVITVLLQLVWT